MARASFASARGGKASRISTETAALWRLTEGVTHAGRIRRRSLTEADSSRARRCELARAHRDLAGRDIAGRDPGHEPQEGAPGPEPRRNDPAFGICSVQPKDSPGQTGCRHGKFLHERHAGLTVTVTPPRLGAALPDGGLQPVRAGGYSSGRVPPVRPSAPPPEDSPLARTGSESSGPSADPHYSEKCGGRLGRSSFGPWPGPARQAAKRAECGRHCRISGSSRVRAGRGFVVEGGLTRQWHAVTPADRRGLQQGRLAETGRRAVLPCIPQARVQ